MLKAPLAEELRWAHVTRPAVPLVYLDLNHFIYLANANLAQGPPARERKVLPGYTELLESARRAKTDRRCVFPLSSVHFQEMAHRVPSPRQRKEVADVMEELSDFTYLLGRPTLTELEIEAGLDHIEAAAKPTREPFPLLGPTFGWAFGRTIDFRIKDADTGEDASQPVRAQLGDEAYVELRAKMDYLLERTLLEGPADADLPRLKSLGFDLASVRRSIESRLEFELDTTEVLAKYPEWRRNGRLRDVISAREVVHEWMPAYVRHQLDREKAGGPSDSLTPEQMASFWAAMPQVQVAISMKTHYHRNPARQWRTNDIADIDAMSIAYPYCDAVFTDREARAALRDSTELRPIGTYMPETPIDLVAWLDDCPAAPDHDQLVLHPRSA